MKRVASLDDLHRLALEKGASVDLGGAIFNSGHRVAGGVTRPPPQPPAPAPQPPAPPPPPVPPPKPSAPTPAGFTREDLAKVLATRDAFWMGEIERVTKTMADTFTKLGAKPVDPKGLRFQAHYLASGAVDYIDVVRRPDEAPADPT